jgi:ABC-type sugar transport system ATPase subunit
VSAAVHVQGCAREPVLELRGIGKSFPGVQAVSGVDLNVMASETVALVGENGAGKSTLMKIVAGVIPAPSFTGELRLNGVIRRFRNVREAEAAGIVLVPQELYIAPNLSIAENMFVGKLPGRWGFVDHPRLQAQARERLRFFSVTADPSAPAGILSPSEQRLIMIAAALSKSAKLLILDEPTASLTEGEASHLFERMRQVHAEGVGCLYITHRLDEIEQVADRVAVMRNGRLVASFDTARGKRREIVRAMIGRDPERMPDRRIDVRSAPVLSVTGLRVHDPHGSGRLRVSDVSFSLHRGEILGLFGLVGAGRTELAQAVFGSWRGLVEGTVKIEGREGRPRSPSEAIANGVGMLTENRKQTGLFGGQSVMTNISAASLSAVAGRLFIRAGQERSRDLDLARQLDVRPFSLVAPIDAYSGGNQQKVLLARWLATGPHVLILDEPTYGVDVGARFELYRLIRALADEGTGVLLISSDLEEVTVECDRILVMYKGRITSEFGRGSDRHDVMAAATGYGA